MRFKDILEVCCVLSLFGKLIGDSLACAFSNGSEVAYNGFQFSMSPMYTATENKPSELVYGLSTLFVFHALFRPAVMLVVDQGLFLAPILILNLAVGYAFGIVYLIEWFITQNR